MSDKIPGNEKVSLIDQMRRQHQMYSIQRDQAQVNFQQLVGAIFALDTLIKQHEESLQEKCVNPGAIDNGQVNFQTAEQVA